MLPFMAYINVVDALRWFRPNIFSLRVPQKNYQILIKSGRYIFHFYKSLLTFHWSELSIKISQNISR